jgi:hypothetical protein
MPSLRRCEWYSMISEEYFFQSSPLSTLTPQCCTYLGIQFSCYTYSIAQPQSSFQVIVSHGRRHLILHSAPFAGIFPLRHEPDVLGTAHQIGMQVPSSEPDTVLHLYSSQQSSHEQRMANIYIYIYIYKPYLRGYPHTPGGLRHNLYDITVV